MLSPTFANFIALLDSVTLRILNPAASMLKPIDKNRRLNGAHIRFREWLMTKFAGADAHNWKGFDEFIIEVWNLSGEDVKLIIEIYKQTRSLYRTNLLLQGGRNVFRIPRSHIGDSDSLQMSRIMLYPDLDKEVRLIFTWLDFVKYRAPLELSAPQKVALQQNNKIKCVIWDLDNTLWTGLLADDGEIALRNDVAKLLDCLDQRGILNSIASKNDHQLAWDFIETAGLGKYFLCPAINWLPKSENIKRISENLNLSLDSIAFVDDSPFERAEVAQALPEVRTYDANDICDLLDKPEFIVPISKETKERRLTYAAEARRLATRDEFSGSYLEFLASCGMKAQIFALTLESDVDRCLELIQRSNQLNLRTKRYDRSEFLRLLQDKEALCVAVRCEDLYGDYGLIGFLAVQFSSRKAQLTDLVLSCRIAQKKVENAIFAWLARDLRERGYDHIEAVYIPTKRNGVLLKSLLSVGFDELTAGSEYHTLRLPVARSIPDCNVVTATPLALR